MARRKFRPQKITNNNVDSPYCECPKFINSEKLFEDNVRDIAKSLILIMIVCGIHECKANSTKEVIINIFKHYNKARQRPICEEPPKKMCKRHVLCCLAKHSLMTLVEAQLSYYILKYALKAYYGRLPQNCVKNPVMDLQIICEQPTVWKRAAQRTIKVYAECQGILLPLVHNYEGEIMAIYQRLFNCMKKRTEPIELPQCKINCEHSEKLIVPTATAQKVLLEPNSTKKESIRTPDKTAMDQTVENPFANFRKCCKCNLPLQLCDCKVNPKTGKLCTYCSQGPFVCEWYRLDKEPHVKAKDHVCPIDCASDTSLSGGSVCTCDLPQLSDCEVEETTSDEECDCKLWETQPICVEESASDTEEVEPRMEGYYYCCHMPICDATINMEEKKIISRKSDDIFVESQVIPPAKNIKSVRLPPDVPKKKKALRKKVMKEKTDKGKNTQTDKDKANNQEKELETNENKKMDKDRDKLKFKESENEKKNINENENKNKKENIKENQKKNEIENNKENNKDKDNTNDRNKNIANENALRDNAIKKDNQNAQNALLKKINTLDVDKNNTISKKTDDNSGTGDTKRTDFSDKDQNRRDSLTNKTNINNFNDTSRRRKSFSAASNRIPTKPIHRKLPCCNCCKKKKACQCKKKLRCKPNLRDRIIPAPILC